MKDFKEFIGAEKAPEEKSWAENMEDDFNENCSLTRTQRLYGFIGCFCLGWLVSIIAVFTIPQIGDHPEKFALLYTLGNIIALSSTMFMWGPVSQCKKMFDPTRVIATSVYLGAIVLTLVIAFAVKSVVAVIFCLLLQLGAMLWYCLSYFPYGRAMVKNCFGSVCPGGGGAST